MNTLFAVFLVAVGLLALGVLVFSLYCWLHKPSPEREIRKFTQRVGDVLNSLCQEKGWDIVDDFALWFPNTSKQAHIDYMLLADKFCYCIVVAKLEGSLSGAVEDNFWTWYLTDGSSRVIPNLLSSNMQKASSLESLATSGQNAESLVLPILVLPDTTAIDPALSKNDSGNYIFRLKYLRRGITNIEATAAIDPIDKRSEKLMVERIRRAKESSPASTPSDAVSEAETQPQQGESR